MTWFDESRLDDETALGAADLRLRTLAESGARVRREAGDAAAAIAEAVARSQHGPPPRGDRGRPRLAAAARGPRAVVPGAVRGLARARPARLGRQPRPGRRARARRRRHRHRLRGRRGRPPRLPGRGGLPADSMVAEHAAGRWSTILPTTTRDQLATAVVDARLPPPGRARARAPSPSRSPRPSTRSPSPARRTATSRSTRPRCWPSRSADANPLVWGGSVLAARAARRVAESIRRTSGRTALAGDAEHLLPVIEAGPSARRLRRPVRRGWGRPAPGAGRARRRRRRARAARAARPAAGRGRRARRPHRDRHLRAPAARSPATPRCC